MLKTIRLLCITVSAGRSRSVKNAADTKLNIYDNKCSDIITSRLYNILTGHFLPGNHSFFVKTESFLFREDGIIPFS